MVFNLKSKPIVISFVFGALMLVTGLTYVGLKLMSKTNLTGRSGQSATPSSLVKTEAGNPRAIVTDPEKYSKEMAAAAKSAAPSTPVQVKISSAGFVPAEVTVKAPNIITFKNMDEVNHSVKGTSGKWGSLKDLEPNESYSQQFDVAGTYEYSDPLNPTLKGKIIVE